MTVCLDSNAYSDFKRGISAVARLLERADEVIVPAVVLGELHAGFAGGVRRAENEHELRLFLRKSGVRFVPVEDRIARRYGDLVAFLRRQGTPIPTNDIWIAAATLEHGAVLLSRDAHFDRVPLLERMEGESA